MQSTGSGWANEATAGVTRSCDGLTATSAHRSVGSGLRGGSGLTLYVRITLLTFRSRGPRGAGVPLLASGSGWSLAAWIALLTLGARRTLEAGLALFPSGSRPTLGAWSARCSRRAFWPGLALHIGQLPGQLARSKLERVQALRRRRLAGSAWFGFGRTRPLGLPRRCSSLGRSRAWVSCHSSLLRERGRGIGTLRLTHRQRVSILQRNPTVFPPVVAAPRPTCGPCPLNARRRLPSGSVAA
jgi:hypothetical protein